MDKNALSQYQTDNFLRFDIFDLNNDLVHYGGWNTADTIDLSNKAVTLGSAFTQEVWIFSDQRGWTTQEIIGYTPSDDKNRSPSIRTRDHGKSIGYGFGDGSDWYGEIATDVISTPGWYHVAVTFDGSDYKLFVNGSEVKILALQQVYLQ